MNVELENTLCDSKVLAMAGFLPAVDETTDLDTDDRTFDPCDQDDDDTIVGGFDDDRALAEDVDPYADDARFEGLQVAEFDG